jgi:hypothetical protein
MPGYAIAQKQPSHTGFRQTEAQEKWTTSGDKLTGEMLLSASWKSRERKPIKLKSPTREERKAVLLFTRWRFKL